MRMMIKHLVLLSLFFITNVVQPFNHLIQFGNNLHGNLIDKWPGFAHYDQQEIINQMESFVDHIPDWEITWYLARCYISFYLIDDMKKWSEENKEEIRRYNSFLRMRSQKIIRDYPLIPVFPPLYNPVHLRTELIQSCMWCILSNVLMKEAIYYQATSRYKVKPKNKKYMIDCSLACKEYYTFIEKSLLKTAREQAINWLIKNNAYTPLRKAFMQELKIKTRIDLRKE